MLNVLLMFLSFYDIRHCHSLCLKRNALFFESKGAKQCKLYFIDPRKLSAPIEGALACNKEVFMSNYYTPESCCVTKKNNCREICLT